MPYVSICKLRAFPMDCLQSSETWHQARAENLMPDPTWGSLSLQTSWPIKLCQLDMSPVQMNSLWRLTMQWAISACTAWELQASTDPQSLITYSTAESRESRTLLRKSICAKRCNLALHGMHFLNPNKTCICGWTYYIYIYIPIQYIRSLE